MPLERAIEAIAAQAGLGISYGGELVRSDTRVSVNVERVSAAEALLAVLRGTGWQALATPAGQLAVVRRPARRGEALQGGISGRVVDAGTGTHLSGASVTPEGSGRGTLSGVDGRYAISAVPAGTHRLRVSLIGYGAVERTVTVREGRTDTVDFALRAEAVALAGIVAVGYGTQRRRDVTGAVASISLDQVRTAPVVSVDQVLQGRAAGVQVVQNNGAPGGGVSVRIRGTNSISANSEPLYVIDGVPVFVGSGSRDAGAVNPLADLSPGDIESIEVLKDASSAAIYGARGASGVVLVTTRRGRRGENTVQIESSYGVQNITRTIALLNARQFAELHNEAVVNAGQDPVFTRAEIAALGTGTDWQEEIFRPAPVQNHSLTVSGGDQMTRYLVTGGFFDQRGIIESSGFRRYSARLNLDREVGGRFRIGNSLAVSRAFSDATVTDRGPSSGVVAAALEFSPTSPVRDGQGNFVLQNPLNVPIANPVATAVEITDQRTTSRLVGNIFAEYDLTDDLRFRTSLGGNAAFVRESYYAPRSTLEGASVGGSARASAAQVSELVNDHLLTYRRTLGGGGLHVTTGFTVQTFRSEFVVGEAQQFASDITGANNLGAGALPLGPSSGVNEWSLLSFLGRANYSLADRYLFTLTGRYDGSSRFGNNDKWGLFPSAALAWRISEEPFLRGVHWISGAKLRLSYGETGNQEIGTYASLARLRDVPYVLGSRQVVTYGPAGQAPNPDLKWESARQANVGLDVGLWDGRWTLSADVYAGTTSDLLLQIPLPKTTGFTSQLRNVGSVKNRGVEIGISALAVQRDDVTWRASLNLASNRNEVVDLGGVSRIFPAGARGITNFEGGVTNVVQVGRPVGTFFGYRTDGIWQLGEDFGSSGDPFAAPGEWRYVDANGDGAINAEDRVVLGDAQADFFGGLTSNLAFGPLMLDVFFQGSFGNQVVNATAVFLKSVSTSSNEFASSFDRWTPENPSNTVPRANLNRRRRLLDVYVEDASHLRLQNVTLACHIPKGVLPGAERAQVYASGQNLWTWTGYSGYDPEVNSYGGDPAFRGVDMGMYPRSRAVNVGVNLTF